MLGLVVLVIGQRLYPNPREFEPVPRDWQEQALPVRFWVYLGAVMLIAAGFVDFPLIAFHWQHTGVVQPGFDRLGLPMLMLALLLAVGFVPLVFWGGGPWVIWGMVLWGIGMGAQESLWKAVVAGLVPPDRRGSAYGMFNTGYGLAWFGGSAVMGMLYDHSLRELILFSLLAQGMAMPLFLWLNRQTR